jgi:hypothetical protein
MPRFEVTIYEKAEHWTFFHVYEAANKEEARRLAIKDYPARSYSIRDVRPNH